MTRAFSPLVALAAAALLAGSGCGSKNAAPPPPSTDADFAVCKGTPAVAFSPGMSVVSASGAYRAAISSASTAQAGGGTVPTAAIGYDTFAVGVTVASDGGAGPDGGAAPPDGLTMTTPAPGSVPADPYMPQHGHGASTDPTITSAGAGQFSVAQIDFFMGGYWQLYLDLTPPGGTADRVTFEICIPTD
jgi:hypothetical protein